MVEILLAVVMALFHLGYANNSAGVPDVVNSIDAGRNALMAAIAQESAIEGQAAGATDAPAAIPPASVEPVDADLVAFGRAVYRRNYCGTCHTLAAAETTGVFGPGHDHVATLALERLADAQYRGTATTVEEYMRESILDPAAYVAPGSMLAHQQMPAFTHLPNEEIEALVYFLLQQK